MSCISCQSHEPNESHDSLSAPISKKSASASKKPAPSTDILDKATKTNPVGTNKNPSKSIASNSKLQDKPQDKLTQKHHEKLEGKLKVNHERKNEIKRKSASKLKAGQSTLVIKATVAQTTATTTLSNSTSLDAHSPAAKLAPVVADQADQANPASLAVFASPAAQANLAIQQVSTVPDQTVSDQADSAGQVASKSLTPIVHTPAIPAGQAAHGQSLSAKSDETVNLGAGTSTDTGTGKGKDNVKDTDKRTGTNKGTSMGTDKPSQAGLTSDQIALDNSTHGVKSAYKAESKVVSEHVENAGHAGKDGKAGNTDNGDATSLDDMAAAKGTNMLENTLENAVEPTVESTVKSKVKPAVENGVESTGNDKTDKNQDEVTCSFEELIEADPYCFESFWYNPEILKIFDHISRKEFLNTAGRFACAWNSLAGHGHDDDELDYEQSRSQAHDCSRESKRERELSCDSAQSSEQANKQSREPELGYGGDCGCSCDSGHDSLELGCGHSRGDDSGRSCDSGHNSGRGQSREEEEG